MLMAMTALQQVLHGELSWKHTRTKTDLLDQHVHQLKCRSDSDGEQEFVTLHVYSIDETEDNDSAYGSLEEGNLPNLDLISGNCRSESTNDKLRDKLLKSSHNSNTNSLPRIYLPESGSYLLNSTEIPVEKCIVLDSSDDVTAHTKSVLYTDSPEPLFEDIEDCIVFDDSDDLTVGTVTVGSQFNDDDNVSFDLVGNADDDDEIIQPIIADVSHKHFPDDINDDLNTSHNTNINAQEDDENKETSNIDHDVLDLNNFEADVGKAYLESVSSKSLSPLIKEELKCRIQCRRLQNGMPETFEEEPDKPKEYKLSDEEIEKKNARLEQNRRSAKKARLRTKESEDSLIKCVEDTTKSIGVLTQTAKQLRQERDRILASLKKHLARCRNKNLSHVHRDILEYLGY